MQLWGNVYNNSQKLKPYVAMPDNIKDFFDAGFRYSNSLSFNGATDKSDYYVSFSQISDDGMIRQMLTATINILFLHAAAIRQER